GGERHHLVLVACAQEAQVGGELLVEQADRVRQRLGGERGEVPVAVHPGEVAGRLAAPVEHQHRAVPVPLPRRRGQRGGGGVRDVVRHVPHDAGVEAGQRGGEEGGGAAGVLDAQPVPGVVELQVRAAQGRVEGVRHGVEVAGLDATLFQAPRGRPFGQFPGGECYRALAVLAPIEPFFLRGGDYATVHDERGGLVVKDGVDAQDTHARAGTHLSAR